MKLANVAKLAVVAVVFMTAGCSSNNKGKIEGTKWINQASTVKGQTIPAGIITMEFKADGGFVQGIGNQNYSGKYSLGMGDNITLNLDQAMDGHKKLQSKFIINGTSLTMRDADGTTIMFTKSN